MQIARIFTLPLKYLICMYCPPTTSYYPLRFNQVQYRYFHMLKCTENRVKKRDSAELNPQSKSVFILLFCGDPGWLTEWRELRELPATPACCAVQEDTALTHIHHTDNCKAHSRADDRPMWPQCQQLLIGILRAVHIPISTVPLFHFLFHKSNC